MLVPEKKYIGANEQQFVGACLLQTVKCLSVISDSATTANLKDFQSCLAELEEAGKERLSEDELQGIIEVI